MNKHTPGPWKHRPSVHGNKYRYVQIGKDESYTTLEVEPADARLIAAAPDLLEALQAAEMALAPFSKDPAEKSLMSRMRAAIAKATKP